MAFVLRTYALSDTDKICLLFTCDYGKVRVVAKGARRIKSRFGALLEPLTEVEISFFEMENRDLYTLSRCEMVQSNFEWASSPEGAAAAHYMLELVDQFLPPAEANPKVYRLVRAITEGMRQHGDLATLLTYFETWMLRLSGFLPALDHCSNCGKDFRDDEIVRIRREGASLCSSCGSSSHGMPLDPAVRRKALEALRLSPKDWIANEPGAVAINGFRSILQALIRYVLERDLKSQHFANFQALATDSHG